MSTAAEALELVRTLCLALPATSERRSHGAPAFYIRDKRMFVTFHDDHHGDGRLGIWCAAPPGAQDFLVRAAPDRYYVPAYVGHLGWVGLRLDRDAGDEEVAGVIEDAWLTRAPKSLVAESGLDRTEGSRG